MEIARYPQTTAASLIAVIQWRERQEDEKVRTPVVNEAYAHRRAPDPQGKDLRQYRPQHHLEGGYV